MFKAKSPVKHDSQKRKFSTNSENASMHQKGKNDRERRTYNKGSKPHAPERDAPITLSPPGHPAPPSRARVTTPPMHCPSVSPNHQKVVDHRPGHIVPVKCPTTDRAFILRALTRNKWTQSQCSRRHASVQSSGCEAASSRPIYAPPLARKLKHASRRVLDQHGLQCAVLQALLPAVCFSERYCCCCFDVCIFAGFFRLWTRDLLFRGGLFSCGSLSLKVCLETFFNYYIYINIAFNKIHTFLQSVINLGFRFVWPISW